MTMIDSEDDPTVTAWHEAQEDAGHEAAALEREVAADQTLGRCRNAERHHWGYCRDCGYGMSDG